MSRNDGYKVCSFPDNPPPHWLPPLELPSPRPPGQGGWVEAVKDARDIISLCTPSGALPSNRNKISAGRRCGQSNAHKRSRGPAKPRPQVSFRPQAVLAYVFIVKLEGKSRTSKNLAARSRFASSNPRASWAGQVRTQASNQPTQRAGPVTPTDPLIEESNPELLYLRCF